MGLRSPQEMQRVRATSPESTRFQNVAPNNISSQFVDTLAGGLKQEEALRLEREKEKLNLSKATFQNIGDDLRIQAQAKTANATGLNAAKQAKEQADWLQKSLEEKFDKLPEVYKPYLKGEVANTMTKFRGFATPHAYSQAKQVEDATYKTRIKNEINGLIESSGDIETFAGEGLAGLEYQARQSATRRYGAEASDLVETEVEMVKSEAVRRSIEQQVAVDRFDLAGQYIERFNEELTPGDRMKAIKAITDAQKKKGTLDASTLADQAYVQGGEDLNTAFDIINKTAKNDQEKKQALAFVSQRALLQAKQKDKNDDNIIAKLNNKIRSGEAVRPQDMEGLSEDKKQAWIDRLNKGRGGLNVVTDWKTFNDLSDRLDKATTAAEVSDINIDVRADVLAPEQRRILEVKKGRLQKAENDEVIAAQQSNSKQVSDVLSAYAKQKGISTRDKEFGELRVLVDTRYNQLLVENPKATRQEIRQKIAAELQQRGQIVEDTSIKLPFTDYTVWERKKNIVNPNFAPERPSMPAQTQRVHPSVRGLLKKTNPSWSESDINRAIQELIKQGKDLSRPRSY